jgi:hypothetical protein
VLLQPLLQRVCQQLPAAGHNSIHPTRVTS